jgi:hypothetical protein
MEGHLNNDASTGQGFGFRFDQVVRVLERIDNRTKVQDAVRPGAGLACAPFRSGTLVDLSFYLRASEDAVRPNSCRWVGSYLG